MAVRGLGVAAVLALLLAGCSSNPLTAGADPLPQGGAPDPTLPGPLAWTRDDYEFGQLVVDDSEVAAYRYAVPVRGSVHAPEGDGPFPLLLFLHGRHVTCQTAAGVSLLFTGACPNATVVEPVDSFRGYDYLGAHLASHGYAVASIDANTINDRDLAGDAGANARARLALFTLDHFASVNATGRSLHDTHGAPGDLTVLPRTEVQHLQGRLDLSRTGLMGHSRGGEGVARAAVLDLAAGSPHGLDAVFALAPTDFAYWPVAGVPLATLLPYCDGDVYNLQGAWMYDDARRLEPAAPRHQVLAMGANHNFYNTKWDGDDWGTGGDPWCGSEESRTGRDSLASQMAHGLGLMASFFRLHVGGEQAFAPLWDGAEPWPASMCPDEASCDGRLLTSTMRLPDGRHDLAPDGRPASDEGVKAKRCTPDTCPSGWTIGRADQSAWTCAGGAAVFPVSGLAGWSALSLRVGVPVDGERATLAAEARGMGVTPLGAIDLAAPPGELPGQPGSGAAKTVLSEVRFPLGGLSAQAADEAASVALRCGPEGGLQVADVMLLR